MLINITLYFLLLHACKLEHLKNVCRPDYRETFEKCSILFNFKEDENFNHRHTSSIPRIKI